MAMIMVLLAFLLPIVIVVMIVVAIIKSVRKDEDKKSESFEKIIRTMYIYCIMIIFLIVIITSTVAVFNSALNILLPEKNEYSETIQIVSRNETIGNLATSTTLLALALPIFIYYSKIAKKDK